VDRELTYQMPFARLRKLGRKSGRKAYPFLWAMRWLMLGTFLAALILVSVFDAAVQRWQASLGLPPFTVFVAILVAYIGVIVVMRRYGVRETQERTNFDSTVHLRKDDGGIRLATDQIEYYLKWPGIAQMFMEPDGVVVAHGSFFFLVPDTAFASTNERNEFIREVHARLGSGARERSEASMRPVLDAAAQ
jgi:hypothetical protein